MHEDKFKKVTEDLMSYCREELGYDDDPDVHYVRDDANAESVLAKTAHYQPHDRTVTVYISKRHPKDILRSLAHELVHHSQNCRGEFDDNMVTEEGYAQNDEHLREMEKEAYLEGQLILRDWTDTKKENNLKMNVNEEFIRNIARRVLESITKEEKKPDADGDGVPPWADKDDDDKEVQEEQIEEGGRHDPDSGYDELRQDRDDAELDKDDEEEIEEQVQTLEEVHDCEASHPGEEHDVWEQSQRVGPIAHTDNTLSENKKAASNYDLYLKEKDGMLFEKLMKKWCK